MRREMQRDCVGIVVVGKELDIEGLRAGEQKKKLQRQSQDINIWQYSPQKTDEGQKYCMQNTSTTNP